MLCVATSAVRLVSIKDRLFHKKTIHFTTAMATADGSKEESGEFQTSEEILSAVPPPVNGVG